MRLLPISRKGFFVLIGSSQVFTSTMLPATSMAKPLPYSPAIEMCKSMELDFDHSQLQVIRSYKHNGDVLVELLGPRQDDFGYGYKYTYGYHHYPNHPNSNDVVETPAQVELNANTNTAPVIICVGHGGRYRPNYIANRTKNSRHIAEGGFSNFSNTTDLYTAEIGLNLAASMIRHYGKDLNDDDDGYGYGWNAKDNNNNGQGRGRGQGQGQGQGAVPYIVINHLHRSKLDVNRLKGPGAQDDPIAQRAWQAYHDYIALAQSKLRQKFGTVRGDGDDMEGVVGLLIDIHGYSGNKDWRRNSSGTTGTGQGPVPTPFIQWGYRLPADILNRENINDYAPRSTMAFASSLPDQDLESLVRGPKSLASRFYAQFQQEGMNGNGNDDDDDDDAVSTGNTSCGICGAGIPSAEFPNPMAVATDPHWCGIARSTGSSPAPSCTYFQGGYTIVTHEHLDWQSEPRVGNLRMNSCQVEFPRCIRFGCLDGVGGNGGTKAWDRARIHANVANAMTVAIHSFLSDLFPSRLGSEAFGSKKNHDCARSLGAASGGRNEQPTVEEQCKYGR